MRRSMAIMSAIALVASLTGCRQDMQDQPKFVPLRGTTFFSDGRSARYQLAGTVARGQEQPDGYFQTGLSNGKEGDGFPFPVTMSVLERGQERFNIYCSPCHSRVGNGEGRIVERGYNRAADFHSERLREAPSGHFFNVITHGYGVMPDYHVELAPVDRWAVVAYIRALQLSQDAKLADAPAGTHIPSLTQVASEQGLPPEFADQDWITSPTPTPIPAGSAASESQAATEGGTNSSSLPAQEARGGNSGSQSPQESLRSVKNGQPPAATAAGDPVAGRHLYTQNCQICHQANRAGLPPMIPALAGIVPKVGIAHIRETVTAGVPTGKPPMPSFAGKFSATEMNDLIAFLKTKP